MSGHLIGVVFLQIPVVIRYSLEILLFS